MSRALPWVAILISFNLLLLNYAGYEAPLTAGEVQVGTNSGITALSSMLKVATNSGTGELGIESSFNQGEAAIVSANTIRVGGSNAQGVYNLTNGTVTAGLMKLRNGNFNQMGGSVTSALQIAIGTYALSSGTLRLPGLDLPNYPGSVYFIDLNAAVMQTGGDQFLW